MGRDILKHNNGFVVCGFGNGPLNDNDLFLFFTDSAGNETERRFIGTAGNDQCWSFVKANDGGYVISGWSDVNTPGTSDVLIVKTDAEGNQLWSKTYGGIYNDLSTDIIAVNDGYVVAGILGGSADENIWILRLDNNGDTLWTYTYGGNAADGAMNVCNNGDGSYGITGYTNSSGNGSTDGFLMNVNDAGAMTGYFPFGTSGYEEPHCITKIENGWIISGHAGTTDIHTHNVFLQFINENGSAGNYFTYGDHEHEGAEAMILFRDKIYITARSASHDPDQDPYTLKIDLNGNLISQDWLGNENEDPAYGMYVDANQVMITGYMLDPASGRKNLFLLRK